MESAAETEATSRHGNITVTERADLSALYKVLRKAIRPLRPRLVTSDDEYPAGSPRLEKHPHKVGKVSIAEHKIEVSLESSGSSAGDQVNGDILWVYEFQPPVQKVTARHTLYYFAGGGFTAPASSEHWKFCAHIASTLASSGGRVVMVSYPLAPHSPARDSLPILRRWLTQTLREDVRDNNIISLIGDSAGANVALSLAIWCADELARARESGDTDTVRYLSGLKSVLAISPPTDMRNLNPAVPLADARDPVLGKSVTDEAARAWSLGSDRTDPYLSPNLVHLRNVSNSDVRVNGVIGTADVLAPDALVFLDKCKAEGVKGHWLLWEDQMHCFPLSACYGLKEGKEARTWVEAVLGDVR
ncbi:Alpha/Beta hydrolase protein [Xylariaceae sp. FL0016]|nr:Alpha/Beta hydrolase protein [Xylariaceae sp. FL0016]